VEAAPMLGIVAKHKTPSRLSHWGIVTALGNKWANPPNLKHVSWALLS